MKSKLTAAAVIVTIVSLAWAADDVSNNWQANGGVMSGDYQTVGHWKKGHVPEAGEYADFRLSDPFTVTMPSGTYASPSGFRVGVGSYGADSKICLDFTESVWTDAGLVVSGSRYGNWMDILSDVRAIRLSYPNSGYHEGPTEKLSGCKIVFSRPAQQSGSICFTGGSANFYDPAGTVKNTGLLGLFFSTSSMTDVLISFDGTDTRMPETQLGGSPVNGELALLSGAHEIFGKLRLETAVSGVFGHTNTVRIGPKATLQTHGDVSMTSKGLDRILVSGSWSGDADQIVRSGADATAVIDLLPGGQATLSTAKFKSDGNLSVNVKGGALTATGVLQLNAGDADSDGSSVLSVSDGTAALSNVYCYNEGAEIDVSGGTLTAGIVYMGFKASSLMPTFRVTGGSATLSGSLIVAHKNAGSGRVILDGGVLTVPSVYKNTGTGDAILTANGGTLRAAGADSSFVKKFDVAKLGPKGLVIDTQAYNITVPQSFQNDSGVQGRLVKIGSGTLTLSGSASVPSEVVSAQGNLLFATGAATATALVVTNGASAAAADCATVAALMVENGGLTLGRDQTMTAAAVTLSDLRLSLSGTYAVNDTVTLLTSATEPSAGTVRAWERVQVVSGAPAGLACRFSVAAEGDVWKFKMSVADPETVIVEQTSSASATDTTDRKMSGFDTLNARAVSGGSLVLSGENLFGTFVKDGAGTVKLTNVDNCFSAGVTLNGGTLFVSPLAALGLTEGSTLTLAGGTFEVSDGTASPATGSFSVRAAAGAGKAYVVKTDTDVELNLPTAASGALVKRGAGSLCYRATGTTGKLTTDNGCQENGKTPTPATEIVFDADGTPPTYGYGGLNIAEGLLAVKGDGVETTSVELKNLIYVGLPVRGLAAQPALTFEDCTIVPAAATQSLELGGGATVGASDVIAPSFAMTNAVLNNLLIFRVGSGSSVMLKPSVSCRSSRLLLRNFYMNSAGSADSLATYDFTDGTFVGCDNMNLAAPVALTFDASRLSKIDGTPIQIVLTDSRSRFDGWFRNGSEYVGPGSHRFSPGHTTTRATLRFDDAKWKPGSGALTVVAEPGQTVVSEGAGLVLEPSEGDAWTFAQPIVCEAPVTVGGAGTVSFVGAAVTNLVLAGTGTVANTALFAASLTVSADNPSALLTFAGCTFAGRTTVDLGRTSEAPLPEPFVEIPVARYSGAAPDVSRWKLVGTGHEDVRGTFTARDGTIFVLPGRRGMVLIVR